MEIEIDGSRVVGDLRREGAYWRAVVNGRHVLVDVRRVGGRLSLLTRAAPDRLPASAGDESVPLAADSHDVAVESQGPGRFLVSVAGHRLSAILPRLARTARAAVTGVSGGGTLVVAAPMPGRIVKVLVAPGDAVRTRQPLIVIEAMKMENELRSPADAVVVDVRAREGTLVEARAVLAVLAPSGTGTPLPTRQTEPTQQTEEP